MIYPIVKYGHPVLESKGGEIVEFDTPELNQLVEDMFASMYAARGVGLAAPQIGIGKRIAVIDIHSGEEPAQRVVLINPKILSVEGSQTGEEGCLSLPGFREPVTRANKVTVRAQDLKGTWFETAGEDFSRRRDDGVVCPREARDRVEQDEHVLLVLDQPLGLFDDHFGDLHVALCRFIERR